MYTLTVHAMMRIKQRNISDAELSAALGGRVFYFQHGTWIHFDPASRCALIFNPSTRQIVTAFRLKKKQVKRWCSRRSVEL